MPLHGAACKDAPCVAGDAENAGQENAGLENAAPGKVWNAASVLTLLYTYI